MYRSIAHSVFILLNLISTVIYADTMQDHYNIRNFKNIFPSSPIQDLKKIPQNSRALTSKFSNSAVESFDKYYAAFFRPWNDDCKFHLIDLQEQLRARKHYRENYEITSKSFYKEIYQAANLSSIGTLNKRAIVINNSNLRVLPTSSHLFSNPSDPGEGYPFDYAQYSYLLIGEPLLISHYSTDGKFAYVRTSSNISGFVLSRDISVVSDELTSTYQKNLVMLTQDTLGKIKNNNDDQIAIQLYMGTVLPLQNEGILAIPIRNSNGIVELQNIYIDPAHYTAKPLAFSKKNVSKVVNQVIGQPYGWGGNLFQADCSHLVRNYFAVFGIYVPLSSRNQSKVNIAIDLSSINNEEKKTELLDKAIPYQTLVYMPGHIGIYMGHYAGEPIIMHSTWGIKVFDDNGIEYRYIIGKCIITTFSAGKELKGFVPGKSDMISKLLLFVNFKAA